VSDPYLFADCSTFPAGITTTHEATTVPDHGAQSSYRLTIFATDRGLLETGDRVARMHPNIPALELNVETTRGDGSLNLRQGSEAWKRRLWRSAGRIVWNEWTLVGAKGWVLTKDKRSESGSIDVARQNRERSTAGLVRRELQNC